jgi:hypothetical protein
LFDEERLRAAKTLGNSRPPAGGPAKQNRLYNDYVRHLPRVPLDAPYERGRLYHMVMGWPKTEKKRRLSFAREDLATVLTAGRLQPAERKLVEALYTRAKQVRGLATFGTAFASHVIDGRLHGQLHAGGAVTGRYTSSNPSLQNIPTDSEFRGFFHAPAGRSLVDVDYSQLELRVFAALSGDAKMIAAFEDGWDYHDLVMQRLGCTRRQAKAVNFGIIFGMVLPRLRPTWASMM